MLRPWILALALAAACAGFTGPAVAGGGNDNDPHMRFPPYGGIPPDDSSQPDPAPNGNSANPEPQSTTAKPAINGPAGNLPSGH